MSNERINWMEWLSEKRRKIKIKILDERNEEMYSRCIDFNLTLIFLYFYLTKYIFSFLLFYLKTNR